MTLKTEGGAGGGADMPVREKLLAAADELFYREGVHVVGIDRVIARAGVAKASLYKTFGSKEELVRAYLAGRQAERVERVTDMLSRHDTARDRVLGMFDLLGQIFSEPDYHGCAFLNASAEAEPGSAAAAECETSRAWVKTFFTDLAREAGATDPERLAQQLVLLYDGSAVSAQMDSDRTAAGAARAVAAVLLDAAVPSPASRKRVLARH
jgi:AcrR family transcriptional regulator